LIASGFAAHAAGIDPVSMTDDDLVAATPDYRVIRIQRQQARTGEDGPGDLAWIWPLACLVLLLMLLRKSRRKYS
jgi:hypothetical protein